MSRVIECRVNDEYILGSGVPIGAAGSFGDVHLRLIFNEMWDGLSIVATFKDALGQSEHVVMLLPSMIVEGAERTYLVTVPKAAKAIAGRCKLTLSGYSTYTIEEGGTKSVKKDSLTNTATAFFRVLEAGSAIVDDESVDAAYLEQVQAALNSFDERINEFDDEMDEWDTKIKDVEDEENERVEAENSRINAEALREQNESSRNLQENTRADMERRREENEDERISAELARQEAETLRKDAEGQRNALVGDLNAALDELHNYAQALIGGGTV